MIRWKPDHIALLSRFYRERVLGVATAEGYLEANRVIGRAAGVRGSTVGRWITGDGHPNPEQSERLVRWAAAVRDPDSGRDPGIARALHELIQESKGRVR